MYKNELTDNYYNKKAIVIHLYPNNPFMYMEKFTDNQLIHIVGSHQSHDSKKLFSDSMSELKKRGYKYAKVVDMYCTLYGGIRVR